VKRPADLSPGSVAFLAAVATGGVGVVGAASGSWRFGATLIGAALLFGSLARFLLPDRMSGLLRVRRKAFDVLWMAALGSGIVVLAVLVPEGV